MRLLLGLGLLLAGCGGVGQIAAEPDADSVLTVERYHHQPRSLAVATAACNDAALHLPRSFELAEAYASGAAVDPGAEEWLYDGTVLYRDARGETHTRTPAPDEQLFPFRCVSELQLEHEAR